MHTARVFFFDLRMNGLNYVERYAYHQAQKYSLDSYEKVLLQSQPNSASTVRPYYLWMKTLQTVLDLPVDSAVRPGLCRDAVNSFRRENHKRKKRRPSKPYCINISSLSVLVECPSRPPRTIAGKDKADPRDRHINPNG